MKKILKFFLWINAALLFILNLSVSLNLVDADSVKLTLKQEQALADECGGEGWQSSCSYIPGGNNGYCYTCTTTGGEKRFICGDSHWWYSNDCKK